MPCCTSARPSAWLSYATTTTAAAATAAAAAESTAAATALRALFGLVHAKRAPVEHRAVHRGDRRGRLVRVAHRHEAEAPRLSALAVTDDVHVRDFA
jgi:hypothetical protein